MSKILRIEFDTESKVKSSTFKDTINQLLKEKYDIDYIKEFGQVPYTRKRVKIAFENEPEKDKVENELNGIIEVSELNLNRFIWT